MRNPCGSSECDLTCCATCQAYMRRHGVATIVRKNSQGDCNWGCSEADVSKPPSKGYLFCRELQLNVQMGHACWLTDATSERFPAPPSDFDRADRGKVAKTVKSETK